MDPYPIDGLSDISSDEEEPVMIIPKKQYKYAKGFLRVITDPWQRRLIWNVVNWYRDARRTKRAKMELARQNRCRHSAISDRPRDIPRVCSKMQDRSFKRHPIVTTKESRYQKPFEREVKREVERKTEEWEPTHRKESVRQTLRDFDTRRKHQIVGVSQTVQSIRTEPVDNYAWSSGTNSIQRNRDVDFDGRRMESDSRRNGRYGRNAHNFHGDSRMTSTSRNFKNEVGSVDRRFGQSSSQSHRHENNVFNFHGDSGMKSVLRNIKNEIDATDGQFGESSGETSERGRNVFNFYGYSVMTEPEVESDFSMRTYPSVKTDYGRHRGESSGSTKLHCDKPEMTGHNVVTTELPSPMLRNDSRHRVIRNINMPAKRVKQEVDSDSDSD